MNNPEKKLHKILSLHPEKDDKSANNQYYKALSKSESNVNKIIQELEFHQMELEIQNQELQLSRELAEITTEHFTEIYDFAPVGYLTLDNEGIICEINLNGAKMFGADRANLLDQNFKRFLTYENMLVFETFFQKVQKSNQKQSCELEIINDKHYSLIAYLEGIVSDEDQRNFVTVFDISERKLAEEKLKNSEAQYRRLFESAMDGILILDADSGKIVDVNPFLYKMLEYDYIDLIGKELWEIGIFKNIEESKDSFIELQRKGYIRFENMPLETRSRKVINVEFVSNVYFVDRRKVIQCNIRDITERKKTEDKLKENEVRLSELNATKDKFFSIIAHDLKSPFTSIMGFSELLKEQIQEKNYDSVEQYAGYIYKSSQHALDLLLNLMEWSQLQTGKIKFAPQNFEIAGLINEVYQLVTDLAQQKSITIQFKYPENLIVFADKAMFSMILRNLISNAIKFTKPGGQVEISIESKTSLLEVSVSDNGIGIRKEDIEKLFRIDESHTTLGTENEQGTGLGLLLCNEFIDLHKGSIRVESQLGKGSTFSFIIPFGNKLG